MAFTVRDYHDLIQLLSEHPEWREELRRTLLTDDFLALPGIVRELAEAQKRTEERLTRLENVVEELAEAQKRTQERLDALVDAQARTERILGDLSRQVGGLSESIGGDIEDVAATVLCETLRREFGWEVGEMERTWVTWDDKEYEIDALGPARDPARPEQKLWIAAEAKHNLTVKDVERFSRVAELARSHLGGEVFTVCFTYRARPAVQARARDLGLRLAFSYGRLI